MSDQFIICEGVKNTQQVSGFIAEKVASLRGTRLTPERATTIREFMDRVDASFVGEFDLTPNNVSYECILDCSQCVSRVAMSVTTELAEIALPPECPNFDKPAIITYDDLVKEINKQ